MTPLVRGFIPAAVDPNQPTTGGRDASQMRQQTLPACTDEPVSYVCLEHQGLLPTADPSEGTASPWPARARAPISVTGLTSPVPA